MNKNDKETLIVIYRSMAVGGIENYIAKMMNSALQANRRVVWVCDKVKRYSPIFKHIIEDSKLEIVPINFSGLNIYKQPKLHFSKGERVKIFVTDIFRLFQAFKIRKNNKNAVIDVIYAIPHFTGSTIIPDKDFRGGIKELIRRRFSYIYNNIFKEGSLYFFSTKHYKIIEENYNLKFKKPENFLVPSIGSRDFYDEDSFRKVYRSESFTIISPGRFEFPHKGYLIGLIKDFVELKNNYPQLRLLIIGDGPDRNKLEEAINEVPLEFQKDIKVHGSVNIDELKRIMRTVNLNISVAACASLGGRVGLISLPARHYVYDCEVYGYFPESRNDTTEIKPGTSAKHYIEQVINMTEEEYITHSKLAYHTFDDEVYDEYFPFTQSTNQNYMPSDIQFFYVKLVYNLLRAKTLLKRLYK